MKKFLSILLILTMICGLTACSFDFDALPKTESNTESSENNVENSENKGNNATEKDTIKGDDFEYKMVKMLEAVYDESEYYTSRVTFVIEMETPYYTVHNFEILTKDGIDIKKEWKEYEYELYHGIICLEQEDLAHATDVGYCDETHLKQYAIEVCSKNSIITADDLVISAEVYHSENLNGMVKIPLEVNGDISELHAKQKYKHHGGLIELDGGYYFVEPNRTGSGSNEYMSYKIVEFGCLNDKYLERLDGKIEYVNKKGETIQPIGNSRCFLRIYDEKYEIGIETTRDGEHLTNEQKSIDDRMYLKYTDLEGFTTYLFF